MIRISSSIEIITKEVKIFVLIPEKFLKLYAIDKKVSMPERNKVMAKWNEGKSSIPVVYSKIPGSIVRIILTCKLPFSGVCY
jgi:hypothetical protein